MLIAEDNPINQKLALSFIGKLGHSADLAGNGAEALNRLQTARYDVILMDLQMPEMDGVEAVQAIRQAERRQPAGEPTQRIIAMTAHAMKGDREKCLQLGFDGYIAKPILLEKLAEEITQVVAAPVLAFDYPLALAQLDNDPALFNELAAMFIDELPGLLNTLQAAIAAQTCDEIKRCAHRLKGETLHFAGSPLTPCLQAIEQAAGAAISRRSLSAVAVGAVEPAATRRADRHRGGNMKTKFWLSLGLLVCASSPCPNAAQRFSRWRLAIP